VLEAADARQKQASKLLEADSEQEEVDLEEPGTKCAK
jgi:hypothetical protein